jgi:hypothetical protein
VASVGRREDAHQHDAPLDPVDLRVSCVIVMSMFAVGEQVVESFYREDRIQ